MNIFVLSRNVRTCARMHCDQHVLKMPLETAQMLSTVVWQQDLPAWERLRAVGLAYLPGHRHHPCTKWAGECINNYLWLARLGIELCAEYSYRFGSDRGGSVTRPVGMLPRSIRGRSAGSSLQEAGRVTDPPLPEIRQHKTLPVLHALRAAMPALPDRRMITPFPLAMPEDCRVPGDPVASYRRYYIEHKGAFARWTRREPPEWFAAAVGSGLLPGPA